MTLNLTKGSALSLVKDSGESLSKIILGLSWDTSFEVTETKKTGGFLGFGGKEETVTRTVRGDSIDLDASCLAFDKDKKLVDNVYFANKNAKGIRHLGDDRTGSNKMTETDNEQIHINLDGLDPRVTSLVFTINSFTGETFNRVKKSWCRVLDDDRSERVRVTLSETGNYTAAILAVIQKTSSGKWEIKNVSKTGNARTSDQLVPLAKEVI